jgi:selT/selW/selH-like putative selenoprotein
LCSTRAASLAAELGESLAIDAKVTPGGRGQFDVVVDGAVLFSKQQKGRFPEDGEIVAALSA